MTERERATELLHEHNGSILLWIRDRFDKVDRDNEAIKTKLAAVHDKVNRHAVYWDITRRAAYALAASVCAWLASLFVRP